MFSHRKKDRSFHAALVEWFFEGLVVFPWSVLLLRLRGWREQSQKYE